jgi:hypothetical protein
MNRKIWLLTISVIILLAFSLSTLAQTKTSSKASGGIRGETYSYKYTEADFADTPSWKTENGSEPPISISQAVQLGKINLPRFVKSSDNWKIRHIFLINFNDDKWFYKISYNCFGGICSELETRQFTIVVKMDGTILQPKKIVLVD